MTTTNEPETWLQLLRSQLAPARDPRLRRIGDRGRRHQGGARAGAARTLEWKPAALRIALDRGTPSSSYASQKRARRSEPRGQRGDPDRGGDERRNRRAHRRRTRCATSNSEGALNADAKRYHMEQLTKFRRFLHIAPLLLWAPLRWLLALFDPGVRALADRAERRESLDCAQRNLRRADAPARGLRARHRQLPDGGLQSTARRACARVAARLRDPDRDCPRPSPCRCAHRAALGAAAAVVALRAHFMHRARIWVEAVSAARRGTEGILSVSRGFATQQTRPDRLKGAAGIHEMRSDERGQQRPAQ